MIPLRCPGKLDRFPTYSLLFVLLFLLLNLSVRFFKSAEFIPFLEEFSFLPNRYSISWFKGLFFSSNLLNLLVNLWFVWIFLPATLKIYSVWRVLFLSILGAALSMYLYSLIHSSTSVPVHSMETWVAVILGMYMRREIWGEVDTFVLGPGWAKVYSVPSYVLLFFYFFYLLCANLLLAEQFSDAPMLYFLPFFSFIWGFLTGSSHSSQ